MLKKLLINVFNPLSSDVFVFLEEREPVESKSRADWLARHKMMLRWKNVLEQLGSEIGFSILPDIIYDPPVRNNAPVTKCVLSDGRKDTIVNALKKATVFIAFSKMSISSTLILACNKIKTLRGASMPGVIKDMERTALAADYANIQQKCKKISKLMDSAQIAEILFSTGHSCRFDLRFRKVLIDDGYCGIEKIKNDYGHLINLPSGEVCQSTYEGERKGFVSQTCGNIPIIINNKIAVLTIDKNRIVDVAGEPDSTDYFLREPGRCNIAEFAIGVNDKAKIRGIILEDEKAGFHFAYGRSDHLGGIWNSSKFKDRGNICHTDVVYAKGCPIHVESGFFVDVNGFRTQIYKKGELVL